MCGIAGILAEKEYVVRNALPPMVACQIHRGPDAGAEEYLPFGDRSLGLGHRRLAIIDLSPAGHQPMAHPITGDQIIFNGEIYNFQEIRAQLLAAGESFRGHSDTEVMLHALTRWGVDAIRKFQGMFAFAFFDKRHTRLILARDSIGIKPLYLARGSGGEWLFASEVRSILASGLVDRKVDRRGLAGLLAYGAVQQPLTIFQSISSFPAGRHQTIEGDGSTQGPVAFWDYPKPNSPLSPDQAIDTLRSTFDVVVRDHLVADVPVGVFLSSGLDSTIVAGIAAKYTPKLRSFTVGFADQPDMSEQALATETAKLFGLEHTNIDVVGSDAEKYVAMWLASLDQPSMDGLNVYVISKVIRERGITVALSGQGGDELFGGYPSFRDVPRLRHLLHRMRNVPRLLRTAGARLATAGKPMAVRQKLLDMMASDGSVHELALQRRRAMSRSQLSALGIDAAALGLDPSFQLPESVAGLEDCDDIVALISRCESQFYQGNMLLRDGDTNGMANSLEIRVPMLDQRMLDLAHSLPGSMRLPPDAPGKHLLRVAFAPLLRPVLAQQGKRGFSLPLRRWMMGPLRERCEAGLRILKSMSILEPRGVDAVWQEFLRDPESPTWSRALTLVVLGVYVEQLRATA